VTPVPEVVVAARFPFGRYAATPWFSSRREHVGNVEWPPSPWRIARALVCTAYRIGGEELATDAVAVVRRLASVEPRYVLPPAGELVYAQWMPQLEYDDHPLARARSENGHALLALEPERELLVRWPGVELDYAERALLGRLLEATPYLGQSVSVCHLKVRDASRPHASDEGAAVPRSAEHELADAPGERTLVRLLAPNESVASDEIAISTADGLVKAMPAPPGSRWVEYVRLTPSRRRPRAREPLVAAVSHRLEGPLRPPVAAPTHPEAGRAGPRGAPRLDALVRRACGFLPDHARVTPVDDDLDGRAERIVVRLAEPLPRSRLASLLAPRSRLTGPAIDCVLRLEDVVWAPEDDLPRATVSPEPRGQLIVFRLESERRPLLTDAVVVCELFRRRLLGIAGRRLGADAIPAKLSGKQPDGRPTRDDHGHLHVLVAAEDGREIDLLAAWCPDGFTQAEACLIRAVTLPMLLGAPIRLVPASDTRFVRPARRFVSHTPFLPVRHPKRRDGRMRHTPEAQVVDELVYRGLPAPSAVTPVEGPWRTFRLVRMAKQGAFPHLGAHGFELEFADPVEGPIAIGRNSHFGMGLFLSAE